MLCLQDVLVDGDIVDYDPSTGAHTIEFPGQTLTEVLGSNPQRPQWNIIGRVSPERVLGELEAAETDTPV
jgi:hypothetical protein